MKSKHFLHADLDAFFSSVEQNDNPELKGKPVIIGGLPTQKRGVVSTASYEARKYGVHSAMSIQQAYKLCPSGIFLPVRMKRYHEVSDTIMNIFRKYSPSVYQLSVDEACIDLTGTKLLFGKPEEIAKKIKSEVYEKTGLTISLGLATTRYIAKIASEINKPNGFFEVLEGCEKDFILSLPLKKLWGIGPKTLKRITEHGITSTNDLKDKSKNLLVTMFGNGTGSFLYDVINANEIEMFSKEISNHSISAERTFEDDITDSYIAETVLLDLCHTIMFRLLKEKAESKTIFVKIRYDDFTTVSCHETKLSKITSIDDLFERVQFLFRKKYENGRALRLLGVGVENVRDAQKEEQQELFNFSENKKQKVEKAILNISKKHPDIKIHKARLLEKTTSLIVLLLTLFCKNIYAKDNIGKTGAATIRTSEENISSEKNSSTLFNFEKGKMNVDFFASGYWDAKLLQSTSFSFGYGTPFALSFGIPVFKQTVDLSLLLTINQSYFFQADFADSFKKNTIMAGYNGKGIVKNVTIANRGIVFPTFYSSNEFQKNITGGKNQSPGISLHLEGEKWRSDAVLRYDMTKQRSATFYGKNSITTISIPLENYEKKTLFTLPSTDIISNIENIFFETKDGTYVCQNGHRYKMLNATEYILLPKRFLIALSKDIKSSIENPRILVTFKNDDTSLIENSLGEFSSPLSENLSEHFLSRVQNHFDKNKFNLEEYCYARTKNDFFTKINSKHALILNSPDGFSPFECNHLYDCGITQAKDSSLIFKNTNQTVKEYTSSITENISFVTEDFFSLPHTYIDIYENQNETKDARAPSTRYPLAKILPEIYLGIAEESAIELELYSYTPVTRFDIGENVNENSITVYKNGIIDRNATFNKDSNTVSLSGKLNDTDTVYITWEEESNDFAQGSISSAVGFLYNFFDFLSLDLSLSSKWAIGTKTKYANKDFSENGFASFTAGIHYQKKELDILNSSIISLENKNVSGLYRILSMDENKNETTYLHSKSIFLLPRDFTLTLIEKNGSEKNLQSTKNKTPLIISPITDEKISGYTFPIEWNFSDTDEWVSTSIELNSGDSIFSGNEFSLALKSLGDVNNVSIYLQLGVNASNEFKPNEENPKRIPTWKIYSSSVPEPNEKILKPFLSSKKNEWQTVSVLLSDYEKSLFKKHKDARIVIVSEGISSKGCILVGPYELSQKTSQAFSSNSIIINATEELDASTPSIKQFNTRDNYVQKIHWKNISTVPLLNDEKIIHIAKHFDEVDFSSYKTLNMHFKFSLTSKETPDATTEDALVFLLDRNAISTESDGQCALKFSISHDSWKTISENTWHKISINLSTRNVYIDDIFISKAEINNSIIPTRLKIKLDTAKDNFLYKEGRFYFDELYLEGMSLNGKFENITRGQYKKDGTIFKTKNDFPILKNVLIETTMKESVDFSKEKKSSFNFLNTSFLSAEVASVLLSFDGVFSNKQKNAIVNAGYTIASTTPLFSVVSFQDEYRYDATSASEYADFFSLDFSNLRVPLALSFHAKSAKTLVSQNQKVSTKLESLFEKEDWNIRFYLSHDANQKKKNFTTDEPDENNESNFASSWLTSIKNAYSIGEKNAIERKQVSEFYLSSVTPFSKFHPEFIFKTFAEYINNSETKFSDKLSFKYSLPFSIKNHSFNFWSEKATTGSNLTTIHGNYFSDYESMFKTWKNRSFFFYSFPIYDLVSTHLCKKIGQDVASSNELDFLNFSTSYNFSWQRNLFSSLADFFMPCSATFSLERDIRQSKTTSDIYQLKTTVITNAFNIFGSTSALKKAKWFEFDEYSTSITGAIKIPKDYPKDITWYLSFYSQQGFFINDFDKLESAIEFSIETNSDWSFRTSATWKRMGKHSPLVFLTSRIYKKYDKENAKIKRSHSFDIHLYSKEKELAQIYTLANSADIQLFSHLAFTSSQSIFFESIQNTVMRLALNLSFSVKLTF